MRPATDAGIEGLLEAIPFPRPLVCELRLQRGIRFNHGLTVRRVAVLRLPATNFDVPLGVVRAGPSLAYPFTQKKLGRMMV